MGILEYFIHVTLSNITKNTNKKHCNLALTGSKISEYQETGIHLSLNLC
jgi:hypothetical protein